MCVSHSRQGCRAVLALTESPARPAIPLSEYYEYFGPDYKLDVKPRTMEEMNTPEYIHKLKQSIFENMRDKDAAPGIQMQGGAKAQAPDSGNCVPDTSPLQRCPNSRMMTMTTRMKTWRIQTSGTAVG